MRIDHLAIWCEDIEAMRTFYTTYFDCKSSSVYHNPKKRFTSYFLTFPDEVTRIELMKNRDIADEPQHRGFVKGIAHFDIEAGSKEDVNRLVARLRADKQVIAGEPRTTGDGYYEAGILDPEGNYIELSAAKD